MPIAPPNRAQGLRSMFVDKVSAASPTAGKLVDFLTPQPTDIPMPGAVGMTYAPKAWLSAAGRAVPVLEHAKGATQILGAAARNLLPEDAFARLLGQGWIRKNGLNYMLREMTPAAVKTIEKDIVSSMPAPGTKVFFDVGKRTFGVDAEDILSGGLEKAIARFR